MHCEFDGDLIAAVAVNRESVFANALVDLRAPHGRYKPVSDFQVKDVIEAMASSDSSVRQLRQPCGRQELMSRQLFAFFLNPLDWHAAPCRDGYRRPLHARTARSSKPRALAAADPLNVLFDQLSNTRGNPSRRFRQLDPQLPRLFLGNDYLLID